MIARGIAVGVLALALASCQAGTFRTFDLDDGGTSHTMDASQRLLLVTSKGGIEGNRRVVCVEPSPDSLTSIAASAAVNGQAQIASNPGGGPTGNAAANAAAAYSESAAYTGMRTQTVQLLRDGLYRACEAYMNGAIDQAQYNILLVNMSQLMVTLTAIDGLTGRPAAPAVILGASGATVHVGADGKIDAVTQPSVIGEPIKLAGAPDGKSAEAVRDIVKAMAGHSTFPSMCLSLMASTHQSPSSPEFMEVRNVCRAVFKKLPEKIAFGPAR